MRKLVLLAHISLDGFVADVNGELGGFDSGEENLEFVCDLTHKADAALFGRTSYQLLNSFWPTAMDNPGATEGQVTYSKWYRDVNKFVISRTLDGQQLPHTAIISNNVAEEVLNIKQQQGGDILVFGSPTASQPLMQANLIDSYWIFVNPVIFGKGIPLFDGSLGLTKLTLIASRHFDNGEIALNYIPRT